jgi:hypothetical protein
LPRESAAKIQGDAGDGASMGRYLRRTSRAKDYLSEKSWSGEAIAAVQPGERWYQASGLKKRTSSETAEKRAGQGGCLAVLVVDSR